jgi:flagellar hook assembly protein FlgD
VTTTLGGAARVGLVIEDQGGARIRTLLPWTHREAGTYEDAWPGDDDTGAVVAEGAYHAILLYELDGVEKRYDLSLTTGGTEHNPQRNELPSTFSPALPYCF